MRSSRSDLSRKNAPPRAPMSNRYIGIDQYVRPIDASPHLWLNRTNSEDQKAERNGRRQQRTPSREWVCPADELSGAGVISVHRGGHEVIRRRASPTFSRGLARRIDVCGYPAPVDKPRLAGCHDRSFGSPGKSAKRRTLPRGLSAHRPIIRSYRQCRLMRKCRSIPSSNILACLQMLKSGARREKSSLEVKQMKLRNVRIALFIAAIVFVCTVEAVSL
jgi:hypothetical protein